MIQIHSDTSNWIPLKVGDWVGWYYLEKNEIHWFQIQAIDEYCKEHNGERGFLITVGKPVWHKEEYFININSELFVRRNGLRILIARSEKEKLVMDMSV